MNAIPVVDINKEMDFEPETPAKTTIIRPVSGLIFITIIIGLCGFAGLRFMDPSTLPVRHVSVTGDFLHLSPESLQSRASTVVRGGFFNVNVDSIQQVLLEDPWVRSVSVKRIWPDRLAINIKEQTAVVQWGEDGLLNPDAEIFNPERSTFPEDLPKLVGPEATHGILLNKYFYIQHLLPEGLSVVTLELSERRSWEIKLSNGALVRLGKNDVDIRLARFLKYFPVTGIGYTGEIDYIDMRYTNGFVIRWNPEYKSGRENGRGNHGQEI